MRQLYLLSFGLYNLTDHQLIHEETRSTYPAQNKSEFAATENNS